MSTEIETTRIVVGAIQAVLAHMDVMREERKWVPLATTAGALASLVDSLVRLDETQSAGAEADIELPARVEALEANPVSWKDVLHLVSRVEALERGAEKCPAPTCGLTRGAAKASAKSGYACVGVEGSPCPCLEAL